jgi:4-amino-4-deoxy-L-arabinose transferase-like glycosyltransferase
MRHDAITTSRIAVAAVFAVGCIVRWIDLGGFGETWDENVNWAAGRNYITNLLALDLSPGSWMWNYEHPPVMKYIAGIGAQFADGFGPARALSAICMALGCALLVPIGTRLYNFRAGVFAAMIATLLPHLVGHGQIVGHEAPTVLWWTLGILLAVGAHDGEPTDRARWLRLAAVGVVIGVAVGSRFVNGLLGPLLLAIVVVQAPDVRRMRSLVEGAVVMPVVALVTFVALWPRLWLHPIASLEASFAKLAQPHSLEPFLGELTKDPGPSYFAAYLVATLPTLVLAGACGWLARAFRERTRGSLIVALWLVVPLGVMVSPVRQDGIRYVMPSVVALALMAAAGWEWFATLGARLFSRMFIAWAALLTLYLGVELIRVHPYYIDYYGTHVGGTANVATRRWFETAWWGEGLADAVGYVNANAAPGAKISRNCVEPAHLGWFRQDLWTPMTTQPAQADWIVAYAPATRPCPIPPGFTLVHTVGVQGAVLAQVYKR